MKLESIWQLEGVLETETPMHIGDGGTRTRKFRRAADEPDEPAEIQTAAKTHDGRARIPGSALKGVVRSGFSEKDPEIKELFGGLEETGNPDQAPHFQGGLAQVLDAYSEEILVWDKLVLGRTAIDSVSGAAQDHLLFHMETVPERTRFAVRIRGKSFLPQRWQDAVALADVGMQRFNGGAIRLGAGESGNRGRCNWELRAVRVMDAGSRATWLQNPEPLDIALAKLGDRKSELKRRDPVAPSRNAKTIHLTLKFDGHPFLVNDPRKTGKKDEGKHAHAARRTADGRLLLPSESFRGVLAHQAARIALTKGKSGDRVRKKKEKDALRWLFGAPDWGSALVIGDFTEVGRPNLPCPEEPKVQEFLAIDRFTGGGSEERKFDAEGGWEPLLQGAITVDLERLGREGRIAPALGLFALTLRDLAEGDLAFGWGSGKGYGWATVDTGQCGAVDWVEQKMAGWCEGSVSDWIRAWEEERQPQ